MSNGTLPSPLSPADNPAAIAHVNLLQGIINRLANNSASCKTWCITLTAAFLSLSGALHQPRIVTFALIPVVIFAFLDAMYLAQERAYRKLYNAIADKIRNGAYARTDAFAAAAPLPFYSVFSAFCSWSIYPIYGGLVLAYLIAFRSGWLTLLTAAN
jgi:hypothetical protein